MKQKIKIFSHKRDTSTNNVMDWLFSFNCECDRTNSISISDANNFSFKIDGENKEPNIGVFKSIWFRKNWFYNSSLNDSSESIQKHLKEELVTFQAAIFRILQSSKAVRVLGTNGINDSYCELNKPYVLFLANRIGIDIPPTLISNSTEDIKEFQREHNTVITKPISDPIFLWGERSSYSMYTNELEKDKIPKTEKCFPTIVQKGIDKEFEIRSFFINNIFYSCAIFSQNDSRTSTDFRNYNDTNPSRYVPYKLPKQIEKKLQKLMKILDINTGSIDIIMSKDGTYYFLEVNPVGQFGMISYPCNYHIEKIIAQYLQNER